MINATINDPTAKNQAGNEPTKVGTGSVIADKSAQTPVTAPIFNTPDTPPSPVTSTPANTPPGFDEKTSKQKKKKRFNVKMIAGIFALLLIVVGASAGFFLSQQNQDLRQQAVFEDNNSEDPYYNDDDSPNLQGEDCVTDGTQDCGDYFICSGNTCIEDPDYTFCDGTYCNNDTHLCMDSQCVPLGPGAGSCTLGQCGGNNKVCCEEGIFAGSCMDSDPGAPNPCLPDEACATSTDYVYERGGSCYCNDAGYQCCDYRKELICDGKHYFVGLETQCSNEIDPSCVGSTSTPTPTPTPPPGEPMCKDVAVLENGVEIDPTTAPLSIGTILQFRCAADDPNTQVTSYEFKITEPDGTVIEGATINPVEFSATSLEYQVDQYLEHLVQCRVCTTDGCQEYITIAN